MPRPPKCRRVEFLPDVTYFKPAGISLRTLEEVLLSLEETEAIRLKDIEGLEQEEGARRMEVSRPTFQRILASARQKMADALLHGKAIRVEGGNFEIACRRLRCLNGHEWDIPPRASANGTLELCPTCHAAGIAPLKQAGLVCRGRSTDRLHGVGQRRRKASGKG